MWLKFASVLNLTCTHQRTILSNILNKRAVCQIFSLMRFGFTWKSPDMQLNNVFSPKADFLKIITNLLL